MSGFRNRRRELGCEALESRRMLAQLLPDLFAWEGQNNQYLHNYFVEGDLLRFSTALANQGDGPLEIRGGNVLPNGNQEVYQRIFSDDGSFTDVVAGEFTYHPGHGHIHFDGYAIYNLRDRLPNGDVGDIIATGGKVSFCLIDIARLPGSTNSSSYGSCGSTRQGISAGWSDVYSAGLSDQWINIATVVDGDYYMEIVVDPDDQLIESDETNNTTIIDVTLNRGVTGNGDIFEPNDTFATAENFGALSYLNQPGLSIHEDTDVDYYQFVAPADGDFTAEIVFTSALGDLDLTVFNGSQQVIGSSATSSDVESVTWTVTQGQKYYVRVTGMTNGYDLELDGPGDLLNETIVSDDANLPIQIPDDGPAITSTLVGPDMELTDLNLVINNLQHTYLGDLQIELTSPAGTTVTVIQSAFASPQGFLGGENNFLNTVIDDQATDFLGNGTAPYTGTYNVNHSSVGNNPLSAFNGENAAGTWTFSVQDMAGQDTGTLNSWSLQFAGFQDPDGDQYEPNNAFPQAVDLGLVGDAHEYDLNIHTSVDKDFFRFNADGSGTATVDLLFSHAAGDLEVVLYDDTLTEIVRSATSTDNESIVAAVTDNSLYYIEVLGTAGATNPEYTLNVTGPVNLPGDFNGDGLVDAADVELICAAITGGSTDSQFDLNADGSVNAADGEELVVNIMGFSLADGNFDGVVDVSDFNIFNSHRFQSGCYTEGDYNFDGNIDVSDFNIWNTFKFTTSAAAVPTLKATPEREILPLRQLDRLTVEPSIFGSAQQQPFSPIAKFNQSDEADRYGRAVIEQVFAEETDLQDLAAWKLG